MSRWMDVWLCRILRHGAGGLCSLLMVVPAVVVGFLPNRYDTCFAVESEERLFQPAVYETQSLVVHTDLPAAETKLMMRRLDAMIDRIAKYWKRPLRGQIQCYIVRDLDAWSSADFPHPRVKTVLRHIGGITISYSKANDFQATVYATCKPGVIEHEVVHAYCGQTFGRYGPDWYKEGMASVACHLTSKGTGLRCSPVVMDGIRKNPPLSVREITDAGKFTLPLQKLWKRLSDLEIASDERFVSPSPEIWGASQDELMQRVANSYRWSWALCYFLVNNDNYSGHFRTLGHHYMTGKDTRFEDFFRPVYRQLVFEFDLFVKNLNQGYSVELSRWNWKCLFSSLDRGATAATQVKAAGGFQPSGCNLTAGETYSFRLSGHWRTHSHRGHQETEGDQADENAILVGALLTGNQLCDEFELKPNCQFISPVTGQLYLRCHDHWNQLVDNSGSLRIRISHQPLAK